MPSPREGTLGDVWGHLWSSHWGAAPGIKWAGVGLLLNPPQCLGQPPTEDVRSAARSEERRVGKECLRLCRSRWSPYH